MTLPLLREPPPGPRPVGRPGRPPARSPGARRRRRPLPGLPVAGVAALVTAAHLGHGWFRLAAAIAALSVATAVVVGAAAATLEAG